MTETNKQIIIAYTNHRGETRDRHVIPINVWFGESDWHKGEQWFLRALDTEKQEERDFAMLSINNIRKEVTVEALPKDMDIAKPQKEVKLFTDGGSRGNPGPSAIGYVVFDMNDQLLIKKSKYLGITTNNQAEYQGLKEGLELCISLNIPTVHVYMDSLLVVNQMKGIYKVKNRDLWPTFEAIKDLLTHFKQVTFTHVPRELNKIADGMVNECLDTEIQ